jgi:transposase
MAPLTDGYRYQERVAMYADITQRWVVVYSEARQARGQRTVEKQVRTESAAELKAFQQRCHTAFACAADAQQALQTFQQRLQATRLAGVTLRAVTCYGNRGRPRTDTVVYPPTIYTDLADLTCEW